MYCKIPHNALTIQPNGDLSVCCGAERTWNFGHISTVEDIEKAWLESSDVNDLRNDVEPLVTDVCGNCISNAKAGARNTWYHSNIIGTSLKSRLSHNTGKITFLELTPSNICNQTCVTCSSYYSSKWAPIEREMDDMGLDLSEWKDVGSLGFNDYGVKPYFMRDEDVAKIMPLLPHLELIVIKGGEPFADDNNYRILEELLKVNSKCSISICTNLSKLPQKYLDLFKDKDNLFDFSVSMDGVGETYEWVRSTPFDQTLNNILRVRDSGINYRMNVNHRINIFNMYNLHDTLSFWSQNAKEYNVEFSQMGWVYEPRYASPSALLGIEELDNIIEGTGISRPNSPFDMTMEEMKMWRKRMRMFISFMNYKRDIDIYKIHTELNNIG